MATPRKKWSTTTVGHHSRRTHQSQAATYRFVQTLSEQFREGMLREDVTAVKVWVDEGNGQWQLYETLMLKDLTP